MSASRLAKILDQEMIERAGTTIAPATTLDAHLPRRAGSDVSRELGGRFLIRYMLHRQLGSFRGGSTAKHFVTPTPLSVASVGPYLALPSVSEPRPFALLIDAAAVTVVQGPRWVRGGDGIEYLLPDGFRPDALALPWEIQIA